MRELGRVDSTCFVLVGWMALMQQRERDLLLTCDVYMVACASSSRVRFPAKRLDAITPYYIMYRPGNDISVGLLFYFTRTPLKRGAAIIL